MVSYRNTADDTLLLKYSGELGLYDAPELKNEYNKIRKEGISNLVVDLNEVTYIDSSGMGALIYMYSDAKRQGIKFLIRGFRKQFVKKIVNKLNLDIGVMK